MRVEFYIRKDESVSLGEYLTPSLVRDMYVVPVIGDCIELPDREHVVTYTRVKDRIWFLRKDIPYVQVNCEPVP